MQAWSPARLILPAELSFNGLAVQRLVPLHPNVPETTDLIKLA